LKKSKTSQNKSTKMCSTREVWQHDYWISINSIVVD